nr:MAG TPA: hypothetical protein [Caudoviricetes sp.]
MKFDGLKMVNENSKKVREEMEARKFKNRIKRLFNKKQPKRLILNPDSK